MCDSPRSPVFLPQPGQSLNVGVVSRKTAQKHAQIDGFVEDFYTVGESGNAFYAAREEEKSDSRSA